MTAAPLCNLHRGLMRTSDPPQTSADILLLAKRTRHFSTDPTAGQPELQNTVLYLFYGWVWAMPARHICAVPVVQAWHGHLEELRQRAELSDLRLDNLLRHFVQLIHFLMDECGLHEVEEAGELKLCWVKRSRKNPQKALLALLSDPEAKAISAFFRKRKGELSAESFGTQCTDLRHVLAWLKSKGYSRVGAEILKQSEIHICPLPLVEEWCAHLEARASSCDLVREVAGNLRRRFIAYTHFLMEQAGIEEAEGEAGLELRWKKEEEAAPAQVLTEMIVDPSGKWLKQYLQEQGKMLKTSTLRVVGSDLRQAYHWLREKNQTGLPKRRLNEITSVGVQVSSLALVEAWLDSCYATSGCAATRRVQFQHFVLWIAERRLICIADEAEERTWEALKAAVSGKALELRKTADLLDTVTGRICLCAADEVAGFLAHLRQNTDRTKRDARIRMQQICSTVRRFYAWAHEQGYTAFSSEQVVTPFTFARRRRG